MSHRDATIREFQYFLCILLIIILINITIKYENFKKSVEPLECARFEMTF